MQGAGVEVAEETSQKALEISDLCIAQQIDLEHGASTHSPKAELPVSPQPKWALTGVIERGTAAWSARRAKPGYIFLVFILCS